MVANGHDWRAVTQDYPLPLLQLFYDAAQKRVAKERAEQSITLLQMVRLAYASARDKKALSDYRRVLAALEKQAAQVEAPTQAEAIKSFVGRFKTIKR